MPGRTSGVDQPGRVPRTPKVARGLILALLPAALATACSRKAEQPLATLGDRTITDGDFRRHLERAFSLDEAALVHRDPSRRQALLEEYLDDLAVAARARRLGIDREPRLGKAIELWEMKSLAHLLTERHRARIQSTMKVSEQEIEQYYDRHLAEFAAAPSFTARHLLVYVRGNPAFPDQGLEDAHARAKARRALKALRAGTGWNLVAKTYSDDLSTRDRGGLIHDGRLGYFAPEVERAVRTQAKGRPGDLVKSVFGYHVLQVESRILGEVPEPLEKVAHLIRERLSGARAAEARAAFIWPIAREVGFKITPAGKRDASLLDEDAVPPNEVLAEVAGKQVLESDFRWFVKDAVIASQRPLAFSRPGARQGMLSSYLDMLVLEAKARKEGLGNSAEHARQRYRVERALLLEFVQERDKVGPFCQCQEPSQAGPEATKPYLARLRTEAGLTVPVESGEPDSRGWRSPVQLHGPAPDQ